MKSKVITCTIIALLIGFILYASLKLFVEPTPSEPTIQSSTIDINKNIKISDKEVSTIFYKGDILDIHITYGNIYEKEIKIDNNNDEDITYSLRISDGYKSNNELYYDLYVGYNEDEYIKVVEDSTLDLDASLIYNLVISKHSSNRIKVVFKSKHENEESVIKGKLLITDNISSLELFNIGIKNITDAIDNKIDKNNGISQNGYYIINVDELSFNNDASLKGYIVIDASGIALIKYIYTIYNDKYMVRNNNSNSINVVNVDNEYINSLNNDVVCSEYDTRITCNTNIPRSSSNKLKEFYNQSIELINLFNSEYDKEDDRVYIYDITKDLSKSYSLQGYILKDKNNMFLYIRNDLFMIAGYNYSKLGEYNLKSSTIRTYVESAFELSALDKNTVCSFSGYDKCYDKEGNRIGSEL